MSKILLPNEFCDVLKWGLKKTSRANQMPFPNYHTHPDEQWDDEASMACELLESELIDWEGVLIKNSNIDYYSDRIPQLLGIGNSWEEILPIPWLPKHTEALKKYIGPHGYALYKAWKAKHEL